MLRGLLVAGAALAVVVAVVQGQWAAAAILTVGILAHGGLWVWLHRNKAATDATAGQAPREASS